jgi:mono/diheme cytochrome c family protein
MIDLAQPEVGRTVVLYPDQPDSEGGDTLRAADLDGDDIDDLLYGAPNYDPVGYDGRLRPNAGILAIIYGVEGGFPNIDGQIQLLDPPDGLRVRFILGADENDMMAYAMAVYDVNGDGFVDIAPNAMGGDGVQNNQINAGEIYVVSGIEFQKGGYVYQEGSSIDITPTPWPTASPVPGLTVTPSQAGDRENGQGYFEQTCFACHGLQGEGVTGLGLPLITSPLVMFATDDELLDFLRIGRPVEHPENVTGVSMPPGGGRPDLSDQQLLDIVAYLRWLRDQR